MDKPVSLAEVKSAIRGSAKGKSPGPDKLPAEFYQEFESLVAEDLLAMEMVSCPAAARGALREECVFSV